MKADQERVKTLLTDTVSLLCKNGLQFSKELKVQGLLGITLDNDDVFVVHINEIFESLLGAQLAGVRAEEHQTSAIAAADSATSDASLRSKKETLSKAYDSTRTPAGGKRKISRQTPSHQVAKVKKEINEEELVILDAKSIDSDEFETEDGSGDGDREAMRKSYGESLRRRGLTPVKQQNKPDSVSESFSGNPTDLSAIVDVLDNEEESRLSGAGYDDSAGCSAWEPSAINQTNTTDLQSQDSVAPPDSPRLVDSLGYEARYPASSATLTSFGMMQSARRPRYNEKPYECPEPGCDRMFYHRGDVYRHQRINHGADHIGKPHMTTKSRGPSYRTERATDNNGSSLFHEPVDMIQDHMMSPSHSVPITGNIETHDYRQMNQAYPATNTTLSTKPDNQNETKGQS